MKLSGNSSFLIDITRTIAAEAVVVGHGLWGFQFFPESYNLYPMQDLAVLVFFIMSGFLISFSVKVKMQNAAYSFKEYFIDRFSRIFSAFVPCLFIIGALDLAFIYFFGENSYNNPHTLNVKTFIGNLLMLQDHPLLLQVKYFLMLSDDSFIYIGNFGSGRPLWSLAIEWWMYMAFGWLILRNASIKKSKYYGVLFCLSIVPIFNVFLGYKGLTFVWFMGCLITVALGYGNGVKNLNSVFMAFLFAGLAFVSEYHFFSGYNILTAASFSIAFYFSISAANGAKRLVPSFVKKAAAFGASFSFTLYLLHYSILEYLLVYPVSVSPLIRFWIYLVLSNVFCFAIAFFTELRYKQLSEYLKKKMLYRNEATDPVNETKQTVLQ